MERTKLNEAVSINNEIILESGEELLIFSPEEYTEFVEKNKVNDHTLKEEKNVDKNSKKLDEGVQQAYNYLIECLDEFEIQLANSNNRDMFMSLIGQAISIYISRYDIDRKKAVNDLIKQIR